MLTDVDSKASKILRINLILIGVLVSVLSIAAQGSGDATNGFGSLRPFINAYVEGGIIALILSTAFAAMTYTTSELDVGVSSDNLATLLKADYSRKEKEALLVKNYAIRINFNRGTNVRNIPLIQLTIVLVVSAVVLFSLGLYDALFQRVPPAGLIGSVLLIGTVVWVSGLPRQLPRAIRDWWRWR